MDGWMIMNEWMDGCMDGWRMDGGWMDGWKGGWMDKQINNMIQ